MGIGGQKWISAFGILKSPCRRCWPERAYYVSCQKRLLKMKHGFEGSTFMKKLTGVEAMLTNVYPVFLKFNQY